MYGVVHAAGNRGLPDAAHRARAGIATHLLAVADDSQWVFFSGNYQEYEADKKKHLGEEAARPHRIRFKALQ